MRIRILLCSTLATLALVAGCGPDALETTAPVDSPDETTLDSDAELLVASKTSDAYGVPITTRTYEVILENLTDDNGGGAAQVLSPPVMASHNPSVRMWRRGKLASPELAAIAEDAINQPMVDLLNGASAVHEVVVGDGVIPPGTSARYEIQTVAGARRLSFATMLVNTNDAFTGTDALRLPRRGEKVYYLKAYDAGSEENTELAEHIPGPCCGSPGMGIETSEKIHPHRGLTGQGDLDVDTYGWKGPVAKLTVRRLAPEYELTLENLTPATGPGASQVFSPPVIATHHPKVRMWRRGRVASEELAAIAEDAINGPMLELLDGSGAVSTVVEGGGVIPPGASDTWTVEASAFARRLSMAFMLVNTNDAFSGTDALRLPRGGQATYTLGAYDAGSEENTELATDIPGPCCGNPEMGTATRERIRPHPGILGHGDLDPATYGWEGPVANLTITRIR